MYHSRESKQTYFKREAFIMSVENEAIRKYLWNFEGGTVQVKKCAETGIAWIKLDNPRKKNALTGRMMVEFFECVTSIESWTECRGVILHGTGGNLCSGADLDFAREIGTPAEGHAMSLWMKETLGRLRRLPVPTVCVAEGPTLGGGAELSVHCDFILVSDNVSYGFVQGRMGIITAWGGATRLQRRIGYTKSLDILLTGRVMSAEECVEVGLAEGIVPSGDALPRAEAWLLSRIVHHKIVVSSFKNVLLEVSELEEENALSYEVEAFAPLWGSEVNKEALEKRIRHID